MYSKEKSCSGGPKVTQSSQKGECTTLVFYSAVQEKKQNNKTRSYSENRLGFFFFLLVLEVIKNSV